MSVGLFAWTWGRREGPGWFLLDQRSCDQILLVDFQTDWPARTEHASASISKGIEPISNGIDNNFVTEM
jgi:hypothetical protein